MSSTNIVESHQEELGEIDSLVELLECDARRPNPDANHHGWNQNSPESARGEEYKANSFFDRAQLIADLWIVLVVGERLNTTCLGVALKTSDHCDAESGDWYGGRGEQGHLRSQPRSGVW